MPASPSHYFNSVGLTVWSYVPCKHYLSKLLWFTHSNDDQLKHQPKKSSLWEKWLRCCSRSTLQQARELQSKAEMGHLEEDKSGQAAAAWRSLRLCMSDDGEVPYAAGKNSTWTMKTGEQNAIVRPWHCQATADVRPYLASSGGAVEAYGWSHVIETRISDLGFISVNHSIIYKLFNYLYHLIRL